MPAMPPLSALYANDQFDANSDGLSSLVNSGFSTVILWTIHVHADGSLYYNDTLAATGGAICTGNCNATNPQGNPIPNLNPAMPQWLAQLRQGGVNTILLSIGSGGGPNYSPSDYSCIQTNLNNPVMWQNFQALATFLSPDGFDFDCEETDIATSTIAMLAQKLSPMSKQGIITFCPCFGPDEQFWLDSMLLIYKNNNQKQLVSWWNLQTYGGADPQTFINGMETFMESNSIGVTNANEMMLAGVAVYSTSAPADVQQQMSAYQSLGLKGGWIWNFGNILSTQSTPAEFATAIEQGLQSSSAATA